MTAAAARRALAYAVAVLAFVGGLTAVGLALAPAEVAAPSTAQMTERAPASLTTLPAAPVTSVPVRWASCAEAKRAGALPLLRGEPGYREAMDTDHDGRACERLGG